MAFLFCWLAAFSFWVGGGLEGCQPTAQPTPTDGGTPEKGTSADTTPRDKAGTSDTKIDGTLAQLHGDLTQYTPAQCGQCHKQHYEDWRGSMHAYAAKDPMFLAMLAKGVHDTKGKIDQFCVQCHTPNASKLGLTKVTQDSTGAHKMLVDLKKHNFGHGVQCTTCHTTKSVESTLNAKFTMDVNTIFGPTGGNAASQMAHKTAASALLVRSTMCGSCHNVVNPKGALLESTFSEWYASDFNGDTPATTKRCQDCHMPTYKGPIVVDGPVKTLHRHTFVGVDQALIPNFPYKKEQAALVKKLLQDCAKLKIERKPNVEGKVALFVSVTSYNNGHNLPSGSTADRQVWVHLEVKDSAGKMLFESGMLDKNGDLMDRIPGHSVTPNGDPFLLMFGQFLFDDKGNHVNFPWEASRTKDNLLEPGQTAWREYLIPYPTLAGKQIQVSAVLRYRTFPPFLVRKLIEEGYLKPDAMEPLPIIDMTNAKASFLIQ